MVPNGWKLVTIEEISSVSSGGTPSRKNESYWNGNIPWVTTAEVQFKIIEDTAEKITEEGLANSSAKLFPVDTILIAMYGQGKTRGQVAKLGIEASTNQACAAIILKAGYHVDYYYQFLISQYDNIREMANSGGQENLSGGIVKSIKVPVPPLPEQKKIAQILSTWDKAISTTEALIETSKHQKKALMQQLLTGKKRLVNPETGKVFEGEWEEVRVANFGKVVTGNTPPKGDDSNYGSDISWATAEDFKGKYVGNTKVKLTKSGVSKARLVPKGSVLVTCIASIGKNAIADEDLTTNQQINAVIVNSKHCNEFFYYQIEFNKHKLLAWAGTTAVPILNKSSFEKILLLAPLKHEQQKIASVLTAADKEIELLQAKLAHLKDEKKALMQQLLTGKRRVKVDENVAA
ncbi:restriction endonuclease subunit S [Moellerella wisconsensis]|uniref:restriction endonuclease subunit S n=1 Tax=Moellerella wisconsensis TaxID=158849 RepID=UPI00240F0F8F|nr:restriction endonuclease subunit S [Moellerella wisconsensis]